MVAEAERVLTNEREGNCAPKSVDAPRAYMPQNLRGDANEKCFCESLIWPKGSETFAKFRALPRARKFRRKICETLGQAKARPGPRER